MDGRQSLCAAAAAFVVAAMVAMGGCAVSGELGHARFLLGGGSSPASGWTPDTPLAVNTRFTVQALHEDSEDDEYRRTGLISSDESVIAPADPDDAGGAWAPFVAAGPGAADVELIDLDTGALIDLLPLVVGEADRLDVRLASGRETPGVFAMVEQTVIAASADLAAAGGMTLNHYDVVQGDTSARSVLDVTTGGDVVKFQSGAAGLVAVDLQAADQPAVSHFDVEVVSERAVDQLSLTVESTCADGEARVVAEFSTADGLVVLGLPVQWSVQGADRFDALGDTLTLSCDDFAAITVSASAAGLSQSADLAVDPAAAAAAGCSIADRGTAAPGILLVLLLAARLRRAQHLG
jgi:hypothetical protein